MPNEQVTLGNALPARKKVNVTFEKPAVIRRINQLKQLMNEQQERMKKAQNEMQGAMTSIHKLEGALEDCEFWQGEIEMTERLEKMDIDTAVAVENNRRNGNYLAENKTEAFVPRLEPTT
jgi:hypothetical protein